LAEDQPTLLIVEDDLEVADMLNAYFRVQGYDVMTVHWGEDCLRACQATHPDLIILDIRLPDINGYEVARRLRSNRRTGDIPIIFLTERRKRADRLQGLELGADDYITKPFDVQELRLRVRNSLRRASFGPLTNPVTNLPERELVDERLTECLQDEDWGLLAISLDNLDSFREAYGFIASDDVVRAVSLMIHNAVREVGGPDDFIGHLSGTKLILVTEPDHLTALHKRIQARLEQSLDYFYPLKDREAGLLHGKRLQIRLGEVTATDGPFDDVDQLKTELLRQSKNP
jgi:DNA-binding response OmpR family regulator